MLHPLGPVPVAAFPPVATAIGGSGSPVEEVFGLGKETNSPLSAMVHAGAGLALEDDREPAVLLR